VPTSTTGSHTKAKTPHKCPVGSVYVTGFPSMVVLSGEPVIVSLLVNDPVDGSYQRAFISARPVEESVQSPW
jgi:hypothetical protein